MTNSHRSWRLQENLGSKKSGDITFDRGLALLEEKAGDDEKLSLAVDQLRQVNQHGLFSELPFKKVWELVEAASRKNVAEKDGDEE